MVRETTKTNTFEGFRKFIYHCWIHPPIQSATAQAGDEGALAPQSAPVNQNCSGMPKICERRPLQKIKKIKKSWQRHQREWA